MHVSRNVFLVDSDVTECNVLSAFLGTSGYKVRTFPSAEAFLEKEESMTDSIMLLEQCLTGMSGLELQDNLVTHDCDLPIVFISVPGNVRVAVKAIKDGAIDFLEKPFSNVELLASVTEAFIHADDNKKNIRWMAELREWFAELTDREREVLQHVVAGMSSKDMEELLGISIRTVENHRFSIMKKMRAHSVPDLIRKFTICENAGPYCLRDKCANRKN
jgi:FixJ family two-component response regulator